MMEIKTKYQYSYFIYPYIVNENKYEKHIYKFLTNKKFKIKQFEKEKDIQIYEYFLPKVREYMFWNLNLSSTKIKKLQEFDPKMQATLLAKNPCTIFEYNLEKDIQGKTDAKDGIFFDIRNIELVCFNTGICFILIKTLLNENSTLKDLCNFNYKFKDINSNLVNAKKVDKIKIQTDTFNNIKNLQSFIKDITGSNKGARELNISTERFITYSYACIGQEFFNTKEKRALIEKEFNKFASIESADCKINIGITKKIEKEQEIKYGFNGSGTVLLASDVNSENFTKLPQRFENEYLYSYLYQLHKKIYLKKLNLDFKTGRKFKNTKNKFLSFIDNSLIQDITDDAIGQELIEMWDDVLGIKECFGRTKQRYDLLYKNENIEKTAKSNRLIVIILIIMVIVNIINSIALHK